MKMENITNNQVVEGIALGFQKYLEKRLYRERWEPLSPGAIQEAIEKGVEKAMKTHLTALPAVRPNVEFSEWSAACATLAAEVRRLREIAEQEPVAYRLKDDEASAHYGRDVWVYWSANEFHEHKDTGRLIGMLEPLVLGPNVKVSDPEGGLPPKGRAQP